MRAEAKLSGYEKGQPGRVRAEGEDNGVWRGMCSLKYIIKVYENTLT